MILASSVFLLLANSHILSSQATEHGRALLCREMQRLGKLKRGLSKRYQFMIRDQGFRFHAYKLQDFGVLRDGGKLVWMDNGRAFGQGCEWLLKCGPFEGTY